MKQKTIILIQNVHFPQQGAIDIFYYAKYLSQDPNLRIKVIVAQIDETLAHPDLELIALGKTNYLVFVRKAFALIKKIHLQESIDYVYFFAQHPFSVLLQGMVKYLLKIPTVYDVVSGPIGKGFIPWIAKWTIKIWVSLSDRYVVLDQWLITKLRLDKKKSHEIVAMGYDPDFFYEKKWLNLFEKKGDEIIFCYIGTLNTERNLDIFIQAFIQNLAQFPSIQLHFVGYGSGEEQLKWLSQQYLGKNIFFHGKQEHAKIPDFINSADIMISYVPKVPYFEYQPPTKLIEYLACNKPSLATNTIAQEELLKGYEFLLHWDDVESTSKKIRESIDQLDLRKSKNYTMAVNDYRRDLLVERIIALLDPR